MAALKRHDKNIVITTYKSLNRLSISPYDDLQALNRLKLSRYNDL